MEVWRWLDIVVVLIVNDVDLWFGGVYFYDLLGSVVGNYEFLGFGGSMVVKLKFKGIDGRVLLGVICLVDFDNEWDFGMLISYVVLCGWCL